MLKQIPLKEKIEKSSLIVEGKVISKTSVWNVTHKSIYTINTVEIHKAFKGHPKETLEVITLGGSVDLKALAVFPGLDLQIGDTGLFCLVNSNVYLEPKNNNKGKSKQFKPYGSVQGFYKYDLLHGHTVNPFNKKITTQKLFYDEILSLTEMEILNVKPINAKTKIKSNKKATPPNSIMFTPTTAAAGIASTITIKGFDFGNDIGDVGFSNADDGGKTFTSALKTQILSWSDNEIVVEVPHRAGTGKIQIKSSSGQFGISIEDLIVPYSEFNIESDDIPTENSGIDRAYQVQHINSYNGGYLWKTHTDFANSAKFPGAKASFEKALDTWRCTTGINWFLDNSDHVTEDASNSDGTNTIRFDNGSELAAGILGRCYSWYSGCATNGKAEWYVEELDLVFDDGIDWYFGSGLPQDNQYDFETVALHELGHAHQLAHVIKDAGDAMHFSTPSGIIQRGLSEDNIEAAKIIQNRNTDSKVCSEPLMLKYQCNFKESTENLESLISIFPVPTQRQLHLKNRSSKKIDEVKIFDARNRLVFNSKTIEHSNTIALDLVRLSRGVYFINIFLKNSVVTKKLLVE